MGNSEILKEYLVVLGAQIDSGSIGRFNSALKGMAKGVTGLATILAVAGAATLKYVDSQIKAEKSLEKTALELRKTKEEALAYNNALKTLNVTKEQLAKDKSLQKEFDELYNQGLALGRRKDASTGINALSELAKEVNRLKVTTQYALQWINDSIFIYLANPLKRMSNWISQNRKKLMQASKKIGEVIGKGAKTIVSIFGTAIKVGGSFIKILERIPSKLKLALGIGGGLLALVKSGPIGWTIAAISGLMILIEDFMRYKEILEHNKLNPMDQINVDDFVDLAGLWEKLDSFENNESINEIKDAFQSIAESIDEIITAISSGELNNLKEAFAWLAESWITVALSEISDMITQIALGIQLIKSLFSGDTDEIKKSAFQFSYGKVSLTQQEKEAELASFRAQYNNPSATEKEKKKAETAYKKINKQKTIEEQNAFISGESGAKGMANVAGNAVKNMAFQATGINLSSYLLKNKIDEKYADGLNNLEKETSKLEESTKNASDKAEKLSKDFINVSASTEDLRKSVNQFIGDLKTIKMPTFSEGGSELRNAIGGIYGHEQLVRISEGDKSEMILPLEKTSRSKALLERASKIIGFDLLNSEAAQTAFHNANILKSPNYQGNGHSNTYNINVSAPVNVTGAETPQKTANAVEYRNNFMLRNVKGMVQ